MAVRGFPSEESLTLASVGITEKFRRDGPSTRMSPFEMLEVSIARLSSYVTVTVYDVAPLLLTLTGFETAVGAIESFDAPTLTLNDPSKVAAASLPLTSATSALRRWTLYTPLSLKSHEPPGGKMR